METLATRPMQARVGDERGSAVAHERQGDAGDRHDAHGHARCSRTSGTRASRGRRRTRACRRSRGEPGGSPGAPQRSANSASSTAAPTKPSSSPTDGEDEVGVLLGDEAQPWVCGRRRALARRCGRGRWPLGLVLVVGVPWLVPLSGSRNVVSRSIWYCFSSPRRDRATAYTMPSSARSDERCRAPGHGEDRHDDHGEHHHRAEVGLEQTEPSARAEPDDRGSRRASISPR